MNEYLRIVAAGETLTGEQARGAMRVIMEGAAEPEEIAGFLVGITARGGTVDEMTGFASVMREFAIPVACEDPNAVDLCGTGGDGAGTFNISTTAVFVAAGAGVTVAKHGNRSVSSSCGSADVLEAVGVRTDVRRSGVEFCLREAGVAFMFAPLFHPAMKHVMPVRKALRVRTFFNILGPLCNPAGVRRQLVGAFSKKAARHMASILGRLGAVHALAVHSDDGMDELSISDESTLFECRMDDGGQTLMTERRFAPEDLHIGRRPLESIRGSDVRQNAEILLHVLDGHPGPHRDIVLINAAHAVAVSGVAESVGGAFELARESIDSGSARQALERLKEASNDAPRG